MPHYASFTEVAALYTLMMLCCMMSVLVLNITLLNLVKWQADVNSFSCSRCPVILSLARQQLGSPGYSGQSWSALTEQAREMK